MSADSGLAGSAAPRRRRNLALLIVERVLLLVALATLGYTAGSVGGAALYQDYESRQLDEVLRGAKPPGERSATPVARRVLGRLEIPTLGVSTIVREGEDARTLQLAIGHIAGTALPGAAGNIGLAAHRDTFFRRLREIDPGDVIRLVAVEGTFTYVVESTQIVDPDDLWVLDPTPEPALTLVTCYPFTYIGEAPERFIVRARLVPSQVKPATSLKGVGLSDLSSIRSQYRHVSAERSASHAGKPAFAVTLSAPTRAVANSNDRRVRGHTAIGQSK